MSTAQSHSFRPRIPEERLKDLRSRLEAHKNEKPPPVPFEGGHERFGITHARFTQLRDTWLSYVSGDKSSAGPTWKKHEQYQETFEHFRVRIEDVELHYIHEKGAKPADGRKVIPLLLLHGWPGSFMEFLEVIKPLALPTSPNSPIFDVIVPSHPGYTFSSSPRVSPDPLNGKPRGEHSGKDGDMLVSDVARIMDKLMQALGYADGYAIQAGDWGSAVARSQSVQFPQRVKAMHLNFIPAPPPPLSLPFPLSLVLPGSASDLLRTLPRRWWLNSPLGSVGDGLGRLTSALGLPLQLCEQDKKKVLRAMEFQESGSAYAAFHGTRPSTLGLVTASDPLTLLAWIGEKFLAWTDDDPSDAEILASLTLWWCTDTMPRSLYPYRNRPPSGAMAVAALPENCISCPTGHSSFPFEIMPSPRTWAAGTANIRWWKEHDQGGHFAAMEQPKIFVADIQECFAQIWPRSK